MNETQSLIKQLIRLPSITPKDMGCLEFIRTQLEPLGFVCERMDFGEGEEKTSNLWAKRSSHTLQPKTFVFAGHTDVVPPGPVSDWKYPPFEPTVEGNLLYGRGASDMKGSIAAFIHAVKTFLKNPTDPKHHIAFLLTSDEEGSAEYGTIKVCEALVNRGESLDWCLVGEPTSEQKTGDIIKNGRRGSMSGKLLVKGVQGHIAYPHLARNPIHQLAPVLAELANTKWDEGYQQFPPTSWQTSNIYGGTGANNVIPGLVTIDFNFRFCPASTTSDLQERFIGILKKHQMEFDLTWHISGQPFFTPITTTKDSLAYTLQESIRVHTGLTPTFSTSGGTSDGRFIANICPQVIEFGPPNQSIHQVNEQIKLEDLEALYLCYLGLLERLVK
jgi:succinyl-diaminopimelate desuccinylase